MNKSELIDALASNQGLTKAASASIIGAIFDADTGIIPATLKAEQDVAIHGFGAFKVAVRKARTAKNPKTGEAIQVAAKKVAKFAPAAALKKSLV